MKTYYERRPVFRAHQFNGVADIDDLKLVGHTEEVSYTCFGKANVEEFLEIAGCRLELGHWLIRRPGNKIFSMTAEEFRLSFEEAE